MARRKVRFGVIPGYRQGVTIIPSQAAMELPHRDGNDHSRSRRTVGPKASIAVPDQLALDIT